VYTLVKLFYKKKNFKNTKKKNIYIVYKKLNNDAYKLKYMKYKAKYLDMMGGAAQPVGEITLDKQTEILAHPTLGIRPKFPLAKLYKAAHITLRPDNFEETDGTYVSIWINPEKGDIICGTGAYPQESILLDNEPKVGPNSTPEDIQGWLQMKRTVEVLPVLVTDDQVPDRQYDDTVGTQFTRITEKYHIITENSHIWSKINTFEKRKLNTLNTFFESLRNQNLSELFSSSGQEKLKDNAIIKELKISDMSQKYTGVGWIKAPLKMDVILQDGIVKKTAIVNLRPHDCVAYFN
jgi:hypothetical protein